MEKMERKETARERKRKWSVVVVTGERKESIQSTKRRWDFYEWVDAFKGPGVNSLSKMIYWRKIHLFYVTPWMFFGFFFLLLVLEMGSARAEPEGCTNTPLPQQPCLDGKVQWVGIVAVTAESLRRGARATTAVQVEDLILGKLLLSIDNLTHSPGVLLVRALLFDCLLLRMTEKQKKVQGLVSLNSSAWSWGNSLWSRFGFGALNIRAVSVLLLVCVIRRK